MLLYLAADLIWATKIKATADALAIPCRPVRTLDMLDARLADSPVAALLVDLDKPDEALAMIRRVRAVAPAAPRSSAPATPPSDTAPPPEPSRRRIRVLAWGPHVAKDLLQAARDAGADEVLTRGALDRSLEDVLLDLAGRG